MLLRPKIKTVRAVKAENEASEVWLQIVKRTGEVILLSALKERRFCAPPIVQIACYYA